MTGYLPLMPTPLGRPKPLSMPPVPPVTFQEAPSPESATDQVRCTRKSSARAVIIALYFSVTLLDLVRGVIHTFLYEIGINDISGLSTGDPLCDDRLSSLMIAYGGANIESFLVRSYVLYDYAGYDRGVDYVRASSIAAAVWEPITRIVSSIGGIDVGDAELPGRYAMLVRSIVSLVTLILTYVLDC
jgi:hypothetical protein